MTESSEAVTVNLREKKRWRKYPCVVKSNHFVIYRDAKVGQPCTGRAHKDIQCLFPLQLNHEMSRTCVHDFDMFFGTMSDVKNPAPTG